MDVVFLHVDDTGKRLYVKSFSTEEVRLSDGPL